MKTLLNIMHEVKPQNTSGSRGETKDRIPRTTVFGLTYFSEIILIKCGFILETMIFFNTVVSLYYVCKNKLACLYGLDCRMHWIHLR
jgi:hypothetical protein